MLLDMKKLLSANVFSLRKKCLGENCLNNSASRSFVRLSACATILLLLFAPFSAPFSFSLACLAQSVQPKLIDVHEHFNGEPGVLNTLLQKLTAADGMGFLLVTQKAFLKPANLSTSTLIASSASAISSSTIPMFSARSTAFIRRDFAASARLPRRSKTTTTNPTGPSTIEPTSTT